jgi:hypothetical protein
LAESDVALRSRGERASGSRGKATPIEISGG